LSIDSLTLKKGEVAFLWFNDYAGVAIRTPSKTLIVDPADVDPAIFKKVDALLITHEHYDHFDESLTREIHRRTQCSVIADSTSAKRLKDVLPAGKLYEMRLGREIKLDNITVRYNPNDCLVSVEGANGIKKGEIKAISYVINSGKKGICDVNFEFMWKGKLVGFVPLTFDINEKYITTLGVVKRMILIFLLLGWTVLTAIMLNRKRRERKK